MSRLLSKIMDDAAAKGDAQKLRQLQDRWARRAYKWDSRQAVAVAFATSWKEQALHETRKGNFHDAHEMETNAQHVLARMYKVPHFYMPTVGIA